MLESLGYRPALLVVLDSDPLPPLAGAALREADGGTEISLVLGDGRAVDLAPSDSTRVEVADVPPALAVVEAGGLQQLAHWLDGDRPDPVGALALQDLVSWAVPELRLTPEGFERLHCLGLSVDEDVLRVELYDALAVVLEHVDLPLDDPAARHLAVLVAETQWVLVTSGTEQSAVPVYGGPGDTPVRQQEQVTSPVGQALWLRDRIGRDRSRPGPVPSAADLM